MDREERKVWIQLLVVLTAVGMIRLGWSHRPGAEVQVGQLRDPVAALDSATQLQSEAGQRSTPLAPGERLDPNTASAIELDRLPGVGKATADAIVAARAEGRFRTASDLTRVRGVGESTVARMAPYLSLPEAAGGTSRGRASPDPDDAPLIDLNRATAEELTALSGIGPAIAQRIVEFRTTEGRFREAEDLLKVRGIGPATLERIRSQLRVR